MICPTPGMVESSNGWILEWLNPQMMESSVNQRIRWRMEHAYFNGWLVPWLHGSRFEWLNHRMGGWLRDGWAICVGVGWFLAATFVCLSLFVTSWHYNKFRTVSRSNPRSIWLPVRKVLGAVALEEDSFVLGSFFFFYLSGTRFVSPSASSNIAA